jgi:hypothetical protein
MAILDDVKLSLRITNTAYNAEITDLINAAKGDLGLSGVLNSAIDTDAMIKRAITLYCKAYFGFANADADRQIAAYNSLKNHLSLSADYAFFAVEISVLAIIDYVDTPIQGAYVTVYRQGYTEKKLTDADGIAIFKVRKADNYYCDIKATGYLPDLHSDDDPNVFDVYANEEFEIVLQAVT